MRRAAADARAQALGLAVGTVKAVNDVVRSARQAAYAEQRRVFDRPIAYTVPPEGLEDRGGSLLAKFAPAPKLAAPSQAQADLMVRAPGQVPTGAVAQEKYLSPQIEGGSRRQKRFERLLSKKGILPPGWFALPGKGAKLDAAGNLPGSLIVKLLAYLQAFGPGARRQNSSDAKIDLLTFGTRRTAPTQFIVVRPKVGPLLPGVGRGLAPGIWEARTFRDPGNPGGSLRGVRAILLFQPRVRYRAIYRIEDVVNAEIARTMPQALARRVSEALASTAARAGGGAS